MKIKQIELLSSDLADTEQFYTQVLGLELHEKQSSCLTLLAGESRLVFRKSEIEKPVYHFAFNIPHNQLNEAEQWVSTKIPLIPFEGKAIIDFDNWNAKSIYFLDNNGNVLEFIARFDLDNVSQKSFDGSSLLSVSEMGFVSENVTQLAQNLIRDYDLSYFEKQKQREDFAALGDDEGLLILSGIERQWFPTAIKVKKFPIKIFLETQQGLIEFEYE